VYTSPNKIILYHKYYYFLYNFNQSSNCLTYRNVRIILFLDGGSRYETHSIFDAGSGTASTHTRSVPRPSKQPHPLLFRSTPIQTPNPNVEPHKELAPPQGGRPCQVSRHARHTSQCHRMSSPRSGWWMVPRWLCILYQRIARVCACCTRRRASERVPTFCLLASPCLFNRGQGIFCVTRERERGWLMAVVCARPGSGSETRKRRVSLAVRSCLRFKRLN